MSSYPLHPVDDKLKVYHANGKYLLDKELIRTSPSFATKYVTVDGMKNVQWKIQMADFWNGHPWENPIQWGIYLFVDSPNPIKCEVSFEITSEKNSLLKQFHGIVTKGSIGTGAFIKQEELSAKKQKFFNGQKTTLYVRASFSYTSLEDQRLYGKTKMIQPLNWTQRFRNHDQKDFKLIVGNESFEIHKFFLILESSVLAAMLQYEHFKENQTGEMKLTGFKAETIKAFVGFCYGEDISEFMESTENAIELLQLADMYDMENLKACFVEYYNGTLTKENVAEVYKVAREMNAPKLRGICFDFIYSIPKNERMNFVKENLDEELHDLFCI